VSLRDGHRDYEHFVPGIVTGSRDGIAQRVRVLGYPAELQLDRKDWLFCYVDSSGAVSVPAAVVAKLANEHGVANEYDTLEAAQAAIRDAMSRS
jgi:hypothetical protein